MKKLLIASLILCTCGLMGAAKGDTQYDVLAYLKNVKDKTPPDSSYLDPAIGGIYEHKMAVAVGIELPSADLEAVVAAGFVDRKQRNELSTLWITAAGEAEITTQDEAWDAAHPPAPSVYQVNADAFYIRAYDDQSAWLRIEVSRTGQFRVTLLTPTEATNLGLPK